MTGGEPSLAISCGYGVEDLWMATRESCGKHVPIGHSLRLSRHACEPTGLLSAESAWKEPCALQACGCESPVEILSMRCATLWIPAERHRCREAGQP